MRHKLPRPGPPPSNLPPPPSTRPGLFFPAECDGDPGRDGAMMSRHSARIRAVFGNESGVINPMHPICTSYAKMVRVYAPLATFSGLKPCRLFGVNRLMVRQLPHHLPAGIEPMIAVRLTATTLVQSSSSRTSISTGGAPTPALLKRRSTRP